jgi:hypothetical protein
MSNLFHSIGEKIASAIAGIVLLFSGFSTSIEISNPPKSSDLESTSSIQIKNEQTSGTSTDFSRLEELEKEIAVLKNQQTGQKNIEINSMNDKKVAVIPQTKEQLGDSNSESDHRQQAIAILNGAKSNYVALSRYSNELGTVILKRDAQIQRLSSDRSSFFAQISFDTKLLKAAKILYDGYSAEVSELKSYETYFNVTVVNDNQANIDQINNLIASIQNSSKPVSNDQMMSYQVTYFGSNLFENNRTTIKSVAEKALKRIEEYNSFYVSAFDSLNNYIENATSPVSYTQQNIPILPLLPQIPQTTRCTISGDGVGLEAYVKCSTSSF